MGFLGLESKRDLLRLYRLTLTLELIGDNSLSIFPVLAYSVVGKMAQIASFHSLCSYYLHNIKVFLP